VTPARTYLAGPTVCGLWSAFEQDFGDPNTDLPLCRVTPSRLGTTLLPFRCPRCSRPIDFSDSKTRESYHDKRVVDGKQRDNHWCPSCGARFTLNLKGQPYTGAANGIAPATVECVVVGADGFTDIMRKTHGAVTIIGRLFEQWIVGTDVLGCCL
jgi:hypothetical protein